jgi:hypothetical protein
VAAATTCQLNTAQVSDAVYDFALRATDVAGNVGQSAVVTREVKNRIGAVALQDPGASLRGSATFTATASSNLGVTSVRMQRAPSPDGAWTDICSDGAAPFSCAVNSTTIPDGANYFRAVMVDGGGFTTTSTVIGPRTVDNSPVRAVDIQAAGNRNALFGNGDVFFYTYSQLLAPGSLLNGWDGSSRNVVVRVRNNRVTGRASDHFEIYTDNSWTTQVGVGTVEMGADVMSAFSDDMTFNGTIVMETVTVDGRPVTRVRLDVGSWRLAGIATAVLGNHQMVWYPMSATRDLFDIGTATTPASESGVADSDL